MTKPKKPQNETERLESLKELQILDTELEKSYDDVTWLAAQICEVPVCLISLIDEDRQWFKSRYGFEKKSGAREHAFCAHAILGRELFEVEDSRKDERFFDNPFVINEPSVVFYAGTQLMAPNDLALGTLCVIDHKPKKLNEFQKKALQILGEQVSRQFEIRRSIQKLATAEATQAALALSVSYSHEVNNPLTIAAGYLEQAKQSIDPKVYQRIHEAHNRISETLKKIQDTIQKNGIQLTDGLNNQEIFNQKMIKTSKEEE